MHRSNKLGEKARAAAPVDGSSPEGLSASHAARLDDLVGASVELIQLAPRALARDGGEAGEAWDRFVDAVEVLDPDVRSGGLRLTGRPAGSERPKAEAGVPGQGAGAPGLSVSAMAAVAAAAARMQSRVEATGDEGLLGAWDLFLGSLLVSP